MRIVEHGGSMQGLSCREVAVVLLAAMLLTSVGALAEATGAADPESKPRAPGTPVPDAPHPGTVAIHYAWNRSTEVMPARGLPDAFLFRCTDADGAPASRAAAVRCTPVVEIETVSTDANGNAVPPSQAASIETSVYGPGHVFIERVVAGPTR